MRITVSVLLLLAGVTACQHMGVTSAGGALFNAHCATCHGEDGAGRDGAAEDAVPDLRYLTKSNAGVFPEQLVYQIIDGQTAAAVHFPRRMPVWGYEFSLQQPVDAPSDKPVRGKINALTGYIRSIQQ